MRKKSMMKKSELTPQNVKLAATYGALSELAHRGYEVTFSVLNTENVDATCWKTGKSVKKIQIKGMGGPYGIWAKKFLSVESEDDLFLIVVRVEKDRPLEFYILTHKEALDAWNKVSWTGKRVSKSGKPYKDDPGLGWKVICQHRDRWDKLN